MSEVVLRSDSGSTLVLTDSPAPEIVLDGGLAGPPGKGFPLGGTTGQVLKKLSSSDYDTAWVDVGAIGGDKSFSQTFNAATVTVNHNLGKYPAVSVIDSAGDEVEGVVDHVTMNTLTLSFSAPFSGTVICN